MYKNKSKHCRECGVRIEEDSELCIDCKPSGTVLNPLGGMWPVLFIITYILAEIFGFIYAINLADLKSGGEESLSFYAFFRVLLLAFAFWGFWYGGQRKSQELRSNGGCFLILNGLLILLVLFIIFIGF